MTGYATWPPAPAHGRRLHVTVSPGADGAAREIFSRGGGTVGSDRDAELDDLAVIVSRTLQHGDTLAAIARGLGRLPDGSPSSVIGAVVDVALAIEREEFTEGGIVSSAEAGKGGAHGPGGLRALVTAVTRP
ncbi:MAG: hypothetical protein WDO24_05960 [Pseudomonadota bacterium]